MKILFSNVNFGSRTGPNTFAMRLALQLGNMGHIIADPNDYDVELTFIENPTGRLKRPVVQRLDGIWFKPDEYHLNSRIQSLYKSSEYVIWQSDFDRRMTTKHFGEKISGVVISNGYPLDNVSSSVYEIHEEIFNLKNEYDVIFCSSANWQPQKRLAANYDLFKLCEKQLRSNGKKAAYIIMGSSPDIRISDKNVFFTGDVEHDVCSSVYRVSDYMIHLAWLDHCPNTVVEAIAHECPVICSSSGGTHEIVGPSGGIVIQDADYGFELMNYDRPPSIDISNFVLPTEKPKINAACVDIMNVAKKYELVFNKLCNK